MVNAIFWHLTGFYIFDTLFENQKFCHQYFMNPNSFPFKLKLVFIVVSLALVGLKSIAQESKVTSDLGLWTEIKLEKEFLKDFKFALSQHLRLHENITGFDNYIAEAGLLYTINKNFELGANGRYTRNKKYNGLLENNYRYDFDFRFEAKLSQRLKLFNRLRYQKEFYGSGVFYEEINYYETAFRNKLKIRWNLNDIHRFYGAGEIFRITKKSREPYFNQFRFWLGDDLDSSLGKFDLAFGIEHQLNNENPYTYYIFKIQYEIEL